MAGMGGGDMDDEDDYGGGSPFGGQNNGDSDFMDAYANPDSCPRTGAGYSSPGHEARQEEEGQGGSDVEDGRGGWTRCAGFHASGGNCGRAAAAASGYVSTTDCLVRRGEAHYFIVARRCLSKRLT